MMLIRVLVAHGSGGSQFQARQVNSSWDPILKKPFTKKGWWSGPRCRSWVQTPEMLNFVKAFSASIEMSTWFLSLLLLYAILHLLICVCWTSPHPWNQTDLVIMVYYLFDMLLNLVCQYFIENFYIHVHYRDWPIILFFCCVFVQSTGEYSVILSSQNEFDSIPSLFTSWKSLRNVGIPFIYNFIKLSFLSF
jgi:hypothetical protein